MHPGHPTDLRVVRLRSIMWFDVLVVAKFCVGRAEYPYTMMDDAR